MVLEMRLDWDAKPKDRKIDNSVRRCSIVYRKSLELMRFFHVFLPEQFEYASNCINANRYVCSTLHRITTFSHSILLGGMPAISKRERVIKKYFRTTFPIFLRLSQICLTILFLPRTSSARWCVRVENAPRVWRTFMNLSNENVILLGHFERTPMQSRGALSGPQVRRFDFRLSAIVLWRNDLQLQQRARQKAREAAGSHRLNSVLGFIAR